MAKPLSSKGITMLKYAAYAPVAQLDRVSVSETGGREFKSRRAHQ